MAIAPSSRPPADPVSRRQRLRLVIVGGLVDGIMRGVLQDGFTLQGINAFTFEIVIGAAILIAMVANIHLARLRGGGPT